MGIYDVNLGAILRAALENPKVRDLFADWHLAYSWGKDDCSGDAQANSIKLGLLRAHEVDRTAFSLAMICDKVQPGDERLGDLAFYGAPVSHVMTVIAPGIVFGGTGGGSKTHGDDPRAYQDLRPLNYRADLTVVGRIKAEHLQ